MQAPYVRDERRVLLVSMEHHLKHILLVGLRPHTDRELSNLQAGGTQTSNVPVHHVLGWLDVSYGTLEVLVPWLLEEGTY